MGATEEGENVEWRAIGTGKSRGERDTEGLSLSPFGKQMQEGEEIGSALFIYPPTHVTRRLQV